MTKLCHERLKYRKCLVTILSSSMTSLTPFDSKGKVTMQISPGRFCSVFAAQWGSKTPG